MAALATQNVSTAFTESFCKSPIVPKNKNKPKYTNLFDIDYLTFKKIKKEFPEYGHLEGDITPKKEHEDQRKKTIKFGLTIKEFI